MSDAKWCPHCGEELENLNYTADFEETQYGKSYGTVGLDLEDHEMDDCNYNSSDGTNESDYEYFCPHCEMVINSIDDLLDEDPSEPEDIVELSKEQLVNRHHVSTLLKIIK